MDESMEVCLKEENYALFIDGGWGQKWTKSMACEKKKYL